MLYKKIQIMTSYIDVTYYVNKNNKKIIKNN